MPVIDVDSHFEIAVPPEEHPLRTMRRHLPSTDEFIVEALTGDLRRATPLSAVPDQSSLVVWGPDPNRSSAEYATFASNGEPRFASMTATERLAWMDTAGIDFALINPGMIGIMACTLDDGHRAEAIRRCNDFVVERLEEHTGRMAPVTLVDWNDLDTAIAELTRMRTAGSRAFWIRAQTYNGVSPAHPAWDRVWSAATDLGMIATLHVGNSPASFQGGWGNSGWNEPDGSGSGGYFRFANSVRHQAAEMMLACMLFGGVFGRHPNLTVITEELGVDWVPHFVGRCDMLGPAGPWPYALTPGEMIRRNLRATPLPGLQDPNPLTPNLLELADMLVFSSDYPHGEGNVDPIGLLDPTLRLLTPTMQARFLGDNVAECFARMGDPVSTVS